MRPRPANARGKGRIKILVIIVTAIILIVAIVRFGPNALAVAFNSDGIIHEAKKARVADDLRTLQQAINIYKDKNGGKLPDSLDQLIERDNTVCNFGPQLGTPRDPWEYEYIYQPNHENGTYRLASYGADGVPGGEGENADISIESLVEKKTK